MLFNVLYLNTYFSLINNSIDIYIVILSNNTRKVGILKDLGDLNISDLLSKLLEDDFLLLGLRLRGDQGLFSWEVVLVDDLERKGHHLRLLGLLLLSFSNLEVFKAGPDRLDFLKLFSDVEVLW